MSDPFALSRDQVRRLDAQAISRGIPGPVLMENAARGAVEILCGLGIDGPVAICAGKGNNAGDGFCMARRLALLGHAVQVELLVDPAELTGDAATAFAPLDGLVELCRGDGLLDRLLRCQWIVDAVLGTGITGAVREPFYSAIQTINRAQRRVLAVDLPSGLDADTGEPLGIAVMAERTVTFAAAKKAFDNPAAFFYTGPVHVVDIGVEVQ